MGKELNEYLDLCIERIKKINSKTILSGLGELVDNDLLVLKLKKYVYLQCSYKIT